MNSCIIPAKTRTPGCSQEGLGIAAEHGYFFRAAGAAGWESRHDGDDTLAHSWREMVLPILQVRAACPGRAVHTLIAHVDVRRSV